MADDNVFYLDTDKEGNNYYLDCNSGLMYILINGVFHVAFYANDSSNFDLLDAAYFRKYILDSEFRKPRLLASNKFGEIVSLYYLGTKLKDVFSVPFLEYTVSSRKELEETINNIHGILLNSKYYKNKKLWFRGQRKEYTVKCSENTINKLGFASEFCEVPSLVPSASRNIANNNFSKLFHLNSIWDKAFKVWKLSQSSTFDNAFSIGQPLYRDLMKNILPEKLIQFVYNCKYDIYDYLIPEFQNDQSSILSTQQYGGYSSMLDITDDLDVALFFTQSKLNIEKNKYELCDPQNENIIYLFAEPRNTSTYNSSENVFFSYDENNSLPKRIKNQKCGLLTGAHALRYNTYAYRAIAKIHLHCSDAQTTKTVEEMFPSVKEDTLYRVFCDVEPKIEGLYG